MLPTMLQVQLKKKKALLNSLKLENKLKLGLNDIVNIF